MRFSRRSLLRHGAVLAGAGLLGVGPAGGARRPSPRRSAVDVCIVGSGFAGVYLGLALARRGYSVTVVEAGPAEAPDLAGAVELFPHRNVGPVRYPVNDARSIAAGGTSRRWTGVVSRLAPDDFERTFKRRAAASPHGAPRGEPAAWPLGYRDLEPYYEQGERLLETRGTHPQPEEPPRSSPYPHALRPGYRGTPFARAQGFYPLAFSARAGKLRQPIRLAERELPELAQQPGATVLTDHPAIELRTRDGRSVDALVVRPRSGGRRQLRARLFVVAAGVFESARLLLRSRSRFFPQGIGNGSGLLGRNLTWHPRHVARVDAAAQLGDISPGTYRSLRPLRELRELGLLGCHFDLNRRNDRTALELSPEVLPRLENGIALASQGDRARDPFGERIALVHCELAEHDLRSQEAGRERHGQVLRALGLDPAAARWESGFHKHPAGTCRMSADAAWGVVNPDCRVFGLDNLFVVGASVFSSSGTSNPTLTVVALALRLADHLAALLS